MPHSGSNPWHVTAVIRAGLLLFAITPGDSLTRSSWTCTQHRQASWTVAASASKNDVIKPSLLEIITIFYSNDDVEIVVSVITIDTRFMVIFSLASQVMAIGITSDRLIIIIVFI